MHKHRMSRAETKVNESSAVKTTFLVNREDYENNGLITKIVEKSEIYILFNGPFFGSIR